MGTENDIKSQDIRNICDGIYCVKFLCHWEEIKILYELIWPATFVYLLFVFIILTLILFKSMNKSGVNLCTKR